MIVVSLLLRKESMKRVGRFAGSSEVGFVAGANSY